MDSSRDLIKNFAGIALTTGVAVFSAGQTGPLISVIGGIAGNLASSWIEKTEYNKVRELIQGGSDPSKLNHDLNKLVAKALEWSIRNISFLYKKNNLNTTQKKELQEFTKQLIESVRQLRLDLDNDRIPIYSKIEKPDSDIFKTFNFEIDHFPIISEELPFRKFFKDHFISNLQLCFGELLKDPNYRPAYIAYQREVKEKLERNIERMIAQNDEIIAQLKEPAVELKTGNRFLKNLAQTISKDWNAERLADEIKTEYAKTLEELRNKTEIILDQLSYIQDDVSEIKGVVRGLDRKLSDNWLSKNKVWVFSVLTLLIMSFAGTIVYNMNRPFQLILRVRQDPGITVLPEYPPISKEAKLRLYLPHDTWEREVSSLKEIILPEIPASLKGAKYKVEISDPYWETATDSLLLSKSEQVIYLKPNASLARIHGRVLSRDGRTLLSGARVLVEGLQTQTDTNGRFHIEVPFEQRKPYYVLRIEKPGYETLETEYRSGLPIEVRLENNL